MSYITLIDQHIVHPCIDCTGTIKVFGYDPSCLRPNSCKPVICRCANCGTLRQKFYRYAGQLCARCSNIINSSGDLSRSKRSIKMRQFYALGGKHPTKGIGHTQAARQKMSQAHTGKKINFTDDARLRLAAHCQRTLNNPVQQAITRSITSKLRGPLSVSYGKPPAHTRKVWYTKLDTTVVCFRSTWEAVFAEWLDAHCIEWEYECRSFPVTYSVDDNLHNGTYTPDFRTGATWYEVKGWWTQKGRAKFNAFELTYPDECIVVIDRLWLKENGLLRKTYKG